MGLICPLVFLAFLSITEAISCSGWRGYLKVTPRCRTEFAASALPWHLQPFKAYSK